MNPSDNCNADNFGESSDKDLILALMIFLKDASHLLYSLDAACVFETLYDYVKIYNLCIFYNILSIF